MKIGITFTGTSIIYLLISKSPFLFESNILSIGVFLLLLFFILKSKKRKRAGVFFSIFMFSFFIVFLPLFIYMQSFNVINLVKPSLFYEYASKGQVKKEIIFTKENLENNGLEKIITDIAKKTSENNKKLSDRRSIYMLLNENYDITFQEFERNDKIQKKISEIKWNTTDVMEYIKRLAVLDFVLFKTSYFISLLFMGMYVLYKFDVRFDLYLWAGIVYTISTLGLISDDLTSIIFFSGASKLQISDNTEFLNVIKESFLTLIIFDTLREIIKAKSTSKVSEAVESKAVVINSNERKNKRACTSIIQHNKRARRKRVAPKIINKV
ncbi:hypothetical protein ACYCS5_04010 [Paenibacillus sp. SEL3]